MEVIIASLGPIIEVGKCIGGPIKRHLNYLCCFNNNIQSLKDEAQKLKDKNDELQRRVAHAKNNAQVINPPVETWLENASQSEDIINGIENEVSDVQKGCLNLISRYSLSRKAKKTAEALRELHNFKFDQISQDAPPASMGSLPMGRKEEFETRRRIEKGVMDALRDRNVNMVGLCGMGGVGKTTMAERIMNRVKEEKLFDEALKVVVSQQVKIYQLQQDIAELLGLNLDVENLFARAHRIRTRLTADTNRILVVVDDVWDSTLKLQDLGIPSGDTFEKCKILLTSRDKSVLDIMETQRIFEIKILPEGEAWILFKEKTGNCVDREDLHSVAEDVAKECKGLPVALVTVGGALKNKECRGLWDDALVQLRSSSPVHLPRVLEHVYSPLKLSYDYLEDKDARSLFLLCSMFKEDADIDLEMLTWCGMGLNMFEGLRNLTEARNRTSALIEVLKDRSLLLGTSHKNYVKMHDVVRDMAIYTALEEKPGGFAIDFDWPSQENCHKDWFWISMTNLSIKTEFPVEFKCPSLCILMMQGGKKQSYEEKLTLPDNFFDGMQEIRVLFMEKICVKSLLPTQMLKNLKTLNLFDCPDLKSISVVGELLKLEILSCNDCDDIEELPVEIGRLNHLRLLEIIGCVNLKRIVRGVISNLINLEELRIKDSFNRWEAKESTNTNAALVELEPHTKLTSLEIEIKDVSLVAEEIHLSSKIEKYDIKIGGTEDIFEVFSERKMCLKIPGPMNVGNWIKTLLQSIEVLLLKGEGAHQDNVFDGMQEIRVLCMKQIKSPPPIQMLKNLKELSLLDCPTLKSINVVGQLLKLEILSCESIEELPTEIGGLKHRRVLRIQWCQNLKRIMRGIISNLISLEELNITESFNGWEAKESIDSKGNAALTELERLTELTLLQIEIEDVCLVAEEICLPSKIKEYYIKIGDIGVFSERHMSLEIPGPMNVGNWVKTLLLSVENLHLKGDGANQVNLMELEQLKYLSFESCSSVKAFVNATSVFPLLESLRLRSLDNLEEIIPTGMNSHNVRMAFPNLKRLELVDLPRLLIVQETLDKDKFFDGMQEIRVLSMEGICIKSPLQIQMLKNLETLRLLRCPASKSISVVGELLKLEILNCETIEELPIEIGGLKHLKELRIWWCQNLKRIVRGVISNLISLEELSMESSFNGWEAKESANTNAALVELEPLTELTMLKIEIKDVSLVAEEIRLPSKIKKCDIKFMDKIQVFKNFSNRDMSLKIPGSMNVGNWIKTLPRSTEVLCLKGDGANQVNLMELEKLKSLSFESCSSVKALVNAASVFTLLKYLKLESLDNLEEITPTGMKSHKVRMAFPNLKHLGLVDLPRLLVQETLDKIVDPGNLSSLWLERLKDDEISSVWFLFSSFSNLEAVMIGGFNGIKNIMSLAIARNLVRLRHLTIDSCKMMLEVIADDEETVQAMRPISLFPHLHFLQLRSLPELRGFYQWNHYNTTLELPSLSLMIIDNCPQMETFTQGSVSTPRLEDISINNKGFDPTKGVNEAIQLYREGEQDEITSSSADP